MANVSIPNLPAAIALSGGEQMEAVQAGMSVRLTTAQIAGLSSGTFAIQIPTAEALRALTTSTSYPVVFMQSYSGTVGDGAAGLFVYNGGDITSGYTTGTGYTVGTTLPSCASYWEGYPLYVTNAASSPSYLGTATSGGSVVVGVRCNGTNWVYE